MSLEQTQFGFKWGPLEVVRIADDPKATMICVETRRGAVDIIVTPSGYVRIHDRTLGGKLWQNNTRCKGGGPS